MIFDRISHRDCYETIPGLKEILDTMAEIHKDNMPKELIQIDGANSFINPASIITRPVNLCRYEAHRQYADVHYIIEGTEEIIVSDLSEVTEIEVFSKDKDIGFYEGDQGTVCILKPGDFLVCFPQHAHKVAVAPSACSDVLKLVGKLRVG